MPDIEEPINAAKLAELLSDPKQFAIAAETLDGLKSLRKDLPNAEGLKLVSSLKNKPLASLWLTTLRSNGVLQSFVTGLQARGAAIDGKESSPKHHMFDERELARFSGRVAAFRCRILVGGAPKGSGILVGPTSVLTAWHVLASDSMEPTLVQDKTITVVLGDNRSIDAVVNEAASSQCADVEWAAHHANAHSVISDSDVGDRDDIALLRLTEPAGFHLKSAPLATPPYAFRNGAVALISYPGGDWKGIEFGKFKQLTNLNARWGYTVEGNQPGSSGGGCFDTDFNLAGIHQGRFSSNVGRLVPLIRFDAKVRQAITNDAVPVSLWSLDGTPEGELVVGRASFFFGYQAAMRATGRVRGLWIKRVDLTNDVSGLPFSYEMLRALAARSTNTQVIRVTLDTLVPDLPAELARRASDAGLKVAVPSARSGVGVDETEPEALVADRSKSLAQRLQKAAKAQNVRLWIFFDHPAVMFGDEARWALAAFVDQALKHENLRVALAGFEPMQMPAAEFTAASQADGPGRRGLMVEYLSHVTREEVTHLLMTAAADMHRRLDDNTAEYITAQILHDIPNVNNRYGSAERALIASRARPHLLTLRQVGVKL